MNTFQQRCEAAIRNAQEAKRIARERQVVQVEDAWGRLVGVQRRDLPSYYAGEPVDTFAWIHGEWVHEDDFAEPGDIYAA